MKKITFLFLILLLSLTTVYGMDTDTGSIDSDTGSMNVDNDSMDMDFDMDFDMGMDDFMDDFGDNLEKSLEASFLNWETNFESMMDDFEINLENNLSAMEKEIEDMMDTFSTKLESDLADLETQLTELTTELPNKLVNTLNSKLDVLFEGLEEQLGNTDEYMDLLNQLTDKITTLEDSGKIKNDILEGALGVIKVNTAIQKDLLVQDNVDILSGIDVSNLSADNVEMVKGLFDGLDLSY